MAAEFNAARETAVRRGGPSFADRLRARRVRPDFAIGAQLYGRMLSVGEGVATPLSDVLSIGQANLEQNLRRLDEAAARVLSQQGAPGKSVREAVALVSASHPTADSLIPETRAMLEDIRQALHRPRRHRPAFRGTLPGHRNAVLYALRLRRHGLARRPGSRSPPKPFTT